jgi:hypothetical protein
METRLERLLNATSKILDESLKAQYISLGKLLNAKIVRFESRTDDKMNCLAENLRALRFQIEKKFKHVEKITDKK